MPELRYGILKHVYAMYRPPGTGYIAVTYKAKILLKRSNSWLNQTVVIQETAILQIHNINEAIHGCKLYAKNLISTRRYGSATRQHPAKELPEHYSEVVPFPYPSIL